MRIRILLVYHGASLNPSKKIFEALSEFKQIKLRVLAPRMGYNPLRNIIMEIPSPYYNKYELVTGRIYKAMRDFSGPYITGLLREILHFRPHVIHIFNEAYSTLNAQALLYRNIFRPCSKCYCLGVENIISKKTKNHKDKFIRNFVHRHCDGVACWSASAKNALLNAGFPSEKLKVTYWGIPLDHNKRVPNDPLEHKLSNSNKFVVGYCGRIEKQKGLQTLLLAVRTLPEDYHILLIGDGSWKHNFFKKVQEFGLTKRVHCVGRVPDESVQNYMNTMNVLVLPSETTTKWKEQFGRVLPEAMSLGLPIIGSDSGAIPEIVGNAGLLFPEGSPRMLADTILQLASNPNLYKNLGELGIRRAAALFSCESLASRLVDLYLENNLHSYAK